MADLKPLIVYLTDQVRDQGGTPNKTALVRLVYLVDVDCCGNSASRQPGWSGGSTTTAPIRSNWSGTSTTTHSFTYSEVADQGMVSPYPPTGGTSTQHSTLASSQRSGGSPTAW